MSTYKKCDMCGTTSDLEELNVVKYNVVCPILRLCTDMNPINIPSRDIDQIDLCDNCRDKTSKEFEIISKEMKKIILSRCKNGIQYTMNLVLVKEDEEKQKVNGEKQVHKVKTVASVITDIKEKEDRKKSVGIKDKQDNKKSVTEDEFIPVEYYYCSVCGKDSSSDGICSHCNNKLCSVNS